MKRARPSVDLLSQQEAENFSEVNNIHTLEMKNIYWSLFTEEFWRLHEENKL